MQLVLNYLQIKKIICLLVKFELINPGNMHQSPSGIDDPNLFWLLCSGSLVLLLPKTINLFSFPIFWLWAYLMKVIPDTHRCKLIFYIYIFLFIKYSTIPQISSTRTTSSHLTQGILSYLYSVDWFCFIDFSVLTPLSAINQLYHGDQF